MSKPIRKAIFPVAGLGTRFLPATKAMPKEMLTVVDRPIIQHVADEARAGGIEHFIFVTGRNKGVIEDHFDRQFELEEVLRRRNKLEELKELEKHLPLPGATSFTRQQEPMGLGHAVWCARDIAGKEPFALLLPDVIVLQNGEGCLGQMIGAYNRLSEKYGPDAKINILAVEEVAPHETSSYGVVGLESQEDDRLWRIKSMVEKPAAGTAPSNLIIMGRYILQPEIFEILKTQTSWRRKRDPAHRRHEDADAGPDVFRLQVQGQELRLRLQAGLFERQRRFRARTPRPRPKVRRRAEKACGGA